jgi:hypothetical protein
MGTWNVSDKAAALLQDALVWDNTMHFSIPCGMLPRHGQSMRRLSAPAVLSH